MAVIDDEAIVEVDFLWVWVVGGGLEMTREGAGLDDAAEAEDATEVTNPPRPPTPGADATAWGIVAAAVVAA